MREREKNCLWRIATDKCARAPTKVHTPADFPEHFNRASSDLQQFWIDGDLQVYWHLKLIPFYGPLWR